MPSEKSMDIVVEFDFQELKNAVDQVQRETITRYDLKDAGIEIELTSDLVKLCANSENQLETVFQILVEKMTRRGVSYKILSRKNIQQAGGMKVRQEIDLIKALNSEQAKEISKKIRDISPKAKANIQGDTVRVFSKSIDDLQLIISALKSDEKLNLPLKFTNYR